MFTGIIEELGIIEKVVPGKLMHFVVRAQTVLKATNIGESISVNGVCLTVVNLDKKRVEFDVMQETQERSSLKFLKVGVGVNLERAIAVNSRFGGHIVSGHIDGMGMVKSKISRSGEVLLEIQAEPDVIRFLVPRGSIAIDGVSLTLVNVYENYFSVALIPHTLKNTTLGFKENKDMVNLENDILSKYIFRYLEQQGKGSSKLSEGYLNSLGFGEE
ncbi:MAG: riboflavin synthase [Candidatus Omnitrophota bacterium]